MALWFECRARYEKIQENGTVKTVTESYLVDALCFSEAESRFIENITPYISGEFTVTVAKKTKIAEIFFSESSSADKYYIVKVNFINIDEKTSAEKKSAQHIVVQAGDFEEALVNFTDGMTGTISDYEIESISETPIIDIFTYHPNEESHDTDD